MRANSCCAAGSTAPTTTIPIPARLRTGPAPKWSAARWTPLLPDITGWTPEEVDTGVALVTALGQFGPGGRALYDPRPGEQRSSGPGVSCRCYHCGDTP